MKKLHNKRGKNQPFMKFDLKMKLTTFFLFASFFSMLANSGYTQSITLHVENKTVAQIIDKIEASSEYRFVYNTKFVDLRRKVSIKVDDVKIETVLSQLFYNTNTSFKIKNTQVVLKNKEITFNTLGLSEPVIYAEIQEYKITGTITDEFGQPLPGANILEKNTTNGVQSDFDGNFSLLVKNENAILVVSYIGFVTQEVSVNSQTALAIVLKEDAAGLDEVVIVGYGSQKKSDVTGSVARADLETFREQGNTSIVQSLQGSVAGLNVGVSTEAGGDVNFSVRGQNNLGGDASANAPLIVVDGIIFRGTLQDINPDDVQSVDVLKDASSTAIYGSQASNGVIIVTTRTGKSGGSGKPVFNYSARYSFKEDANRLTYGTGEDYLDQIRAFNWKSAYPQGPNYDPNYDVLTGLDPQEVEGYNNGTNVDWQDLLTQSGFVNNHNLSVSGNTDNVTYFVSGSFLDNEEIIIGDNYSKVTGRVNLELKLNNWLKVGTNSFVTSADYSGIEFERADITYSPYAAAYDAEGNPVVKVTERFGSSALLTANDLDEDKRTHLNTTLYTVIDIPWIKGLSYRMNYNNSTRTRRHNQFLYATPDRVAQARKDLFFNKDWTIDNILSYNTTLNDVHNIGATFVYGREERYIESTEIGASNFSNEILGYNDLSLGATQDVQSGAEEESSLYQMGRLNYNYDGKYFITGTVRRDGFSGFGKNNKFAVFPSVALGWSVSKEKFFESLSETVSNLKLRMSYGKSGNRALPRYSTLAKVDQNNAYVFGDGGTTFGGQFTSTVAAPNLKWETTTGINIGLDFGLLNNRISGNIEYYNSDTEDILINIDIPSVNGFSQASANLGKVHNSGLEFIINSTNIISDDFSWSSTVNFSTNKNEVVSVLGKDDDGDGIEDDLPSSGFFIGEQLGAIFDYQIDPNNPIYQIGDTDIPPGSEPGFYRLVDQNGGGISSTDDKIILGSTDPAYRFGITNNFKYKNLKLSVFVNSIQGGKNGYLGDNTYWEIDQWTSGGKGKVNGLLPVIVDYWTPNNPNSEYPSLRYDAYDGSRRAKVFRDRSFVRLQDVSLSYSFDDSILQKLGLKHLTLVASGKNLVTWTNWKGIDPEAGFRISYGERPVTRSYTLGINLSF
ncbi:TonB-dependent receptor [Thalassobellus suaedae]|uniref:TonB-dependent receptor n=1 Tax=Thalassobellus suaedae TaxID=3074124 RepID=A0ABY9Y064_9FLAO|nr:TonB-dependent receptor [Flavobacteriaceae bacterium HL-DH10]